MGAVPEAALVRLYLGRFDRTGRALALGPARLVEVEERLRPGPGAEAALLRAAVPEGAAVWLLDERGRDLTSPAFAAALAALRDDGRRDLCILIGGADGLDPGLAETASARIAFGRMVWPHFLARAMLAEQLYRAATILSGHPYHRA
jgi:23S rRNA (pseudouridine1915-N3)-methyltransferase